MDQRQLNIDITELVGRCLHNFDRQGASYEQLTDDSWIDRYQGKMFDDQPWNFKLDAESAQFHARVDCLTVLFIDYIERKVLDSK